MEALFEKKKWKIFNNLFNKFMFILIFIIYKKRNLLFLLNYTNISFINICSCANYIIYLKKKKEKTKYVKRQILENFYRRITEERGGKKGRKEKCYQCQAVFVSIGTSRGACWNVVLASIHGRDIVQTKVSSGLCGL